MKEIKDCYGTILEQGDIVITHTAWGADPSGYSTGIIKCMVSHLSDAGRVMLKPIIIPSGLIQRWPIQTVKYEQTNISN